MTRPHVRANRPISFPSVPVSDGIEIRHACQFISSFVRALATLPVGIGRFLPCGVGFHMSRLRHLGWNQCSHGLTSRPLESCHHQCLKAAVCGGFGLSQGFSIGASGGHTEAPTLHNSFYHASSTDYSKLDYDRVCSSQEWRAEATTHDRSGQPDKTSWRLVQQVRPDHEEILLDGTAQSVRYGEPLRERSGQPDNVNSQEVANSQNFIMGRDTTELELSVESRSFVNQVNDQVRKRQKRISNVAREGEEHSVIW